MVHYPSLGSNDVAGLPNVFWVVRLRPYRPNFYACYTPDPDGNTLLAVCKKPE